MFSFLMLVITKENFIMKIECGFHGNYFMKKVDMLLLLLESKLIRIKNLSSVLKNSNIVIYNIGSLMR